MTLQEKQRPTPAEPVAPDPLVHVEPRETTVAGEESVYVAKDVEPTESPYVAREGEVLDQRRSFSPLMGFGALVVLVVLIYLVYLLFS